MSSPCRVSRYLVVHIGLVALLNRGNSEEISRVVYNCKTYEDPKVDLEYKEAERYCQRNGGQVAKITRDLLSTQVETVLPDNLWIYICLYNGLTYDKPRGVWRWADGSLWTSNDFKWKFSILDIFLDLRCGVICRNNNRWNFVKAECSTESPFLCEYDNTEPSSGTCSSPITTPDWVTSQRDETTPTPKRKPVDAKPRKTIFVRMSQPKLIIGEPEFIMSVPLPTMCSRICLKRKPCGLFNFNRSTRECKGYGSGSSLKYKETVEWDVWVLREV